MNVFHSLDSCNIHAYFIKVIYRLGEAPRLNPQASIATLTLSPTAEILRAAGQE